MSDEALSPAGIHQIAWQIRDDEADPEDARKLIEQFRDMYDGSEPLPPELLRHIRDSFNDYLTGNRKSLDRAFGLKRRRGAPKVDEYVRIAMAAEVLRSRLSGATHQHALLVASRICHRSESVIGEAWTAHQQNGLVQLRLERNHDRYPWSTEEVERLTEIFGAKGWFITPE